jgi:hypothetical protein
LGTEVCTAGKREKAARHGSSPPCCFSDHRRNAAYPSRVVRRTLDQLCTAANSLNDIVEVVRALSRHWALGGMNCLGHARRMPSEPTTYPGYRFPAEVIHHAIWLYCESIQAARPV